MSCNHEVISCVAVILLASLVLLFSITGVMGKPAAAAAVNLQVE